MPVDSPGSAASDPLTGFSAPAREWFGAAFDAPTAAQAGAWASIRQDQHTLVVAPTGSGKTLAAFLWALDGLLAGAGPDAQPGTVDASQRCRVLYVSPLKALASDVQRNLSSPLIGIHAAGQRLGLELAPVQIGIRSGDTPAAERARFARHPPDILITTPESLFLLLTSRAGQALAHVRTVIVDEVHAVAGTKRGAHLALSLERLDALTDRPVQRVGLSATVRPIETVAQFLTGTRTPAEGGRAVQIVAPPAAKTFDLSVQVPVPDMTELGAPTGDLSGNAAGEVARHSIWPAVEERVVDLIAPSGPHRSSLVFTNSRRLAERLTARLNEIWEQRWMAADALAGSAGQAPVGQAPSGQAPVGRPPAQMMAAAGQTAGAPPILAKAHHGSVSMQQRALIEDDLKSGRLPAVVATSSLELGIDMGAIDLVVQVEAPPSVSSGLQRVGRAGHQVGAVSRGVILPKFRGDLVTSAVVTARMRDGQIEALRIPANPLDVLAQQVVAAAAMRDWDVDELFSMCRRATAFGTLSRPVFEAVLDMLAGRYPSEDFAELRPRIVWDRLGNSVSARPGAQRLAVTSGGTIPDRGSFGVFLAGQEPGSPGRRVGELDEEMVYESRVGDLFTLGASTWQIVEITRDQVLVVPAPGAPGRLPFWHGDSVGRPAELGAAVGAFVREVDERDRRGDGTAVQLARDHGLDENAAQNLLRYVADQREATGRVPTDRTLVLEKFRDELGDWRVVLHSPYGAQVHAAWALAVAARITERFGVDAQVMGSDDGIVARLPDTAARWDDPFGFEDPPGGQDSTTPRSATGGDLLDVLAEIVSIDPEEVEALVTGQLGGSALFAARFRECAARALLLPRRRPDKRQPLWQQRQRAAQLLEVAAQYPNFPIVLETVRECLQDVFDLPGLVDLLRQVRAGRVRIVEVSTTHASPFASALMFGYVAAFLYEGDSPLAERRSAALSLDPQLLAEVLGRADAASLADLLDPAAVLATYRQLQWLTPERQVRDAEHLTDLLRSLGPLTGPDIRARTDPATTDADLAAWIGDLKTTRRIVAVRVGGRDCYAVVEDAARLRDALGVPLPVGIPAALLQATPDPLTGLVARYARHQVGFTAEMVARRFGLGVTVAARTLTDLVAAGRLTAATVVPAECAHLLTEDTTTSENTTALDDTTALEDTTRPVGPAGARPGVEQEAIPTGLPAATQFCDTEVLRRLKRRSLAALRADVEPVPQSALGAFNAAWQHVATTTGHRLSGIDGLAEVVEQLAGVAIPASALESLVLPARVRDYSPAWLDELTTSGEVLWAGHGSLPGEDGWISLHPRPTAHLTLPAADVSALTESQAALLAQLSGGGAFFAAELAARLDGAGAASLDADLWALLWAGAVTTDTLAGLRARLGTGRTAHRSRRGPGRARYARTGRPGWRRGLTASATRTNPAAAGARLPAELAGRWSALPAAEADPTLRTAAWAEILLDRYGVLTRGALSAEQVPGGFAAVYKALSVMEETGRVRRGYFVERLGAAQFATAGAVDRLRAVGDAVTRAAEDPHGAAPPRAAALAAADPANPYGAALGWPPVAEGTHRPGRRAGALVVLAGGQLLAYLERGGKTLLTWTEDPAMVRAAAESVARAVHGGAVGRLTVARINGQPALSTSDPARDALLAAGFVAAPSGLRLAPGRTVPATD